MPSDSTQKEQEAAQLSQLRQILLGQQNEQVTNVLKENARTIVGDVFSEAMHDRRGKDGSVDAVLLPIVESSVEKSISNHNEKMVGALYPIVGRLVRKSVTAFLAEFLEKTNELIKNSFTLKGLKWRFKAKQAGVSFSEYVASQTFVFKVEQVLLIQNESGLLLRSVSQNQEESADADMVSGMLTAINDFVADSFNADSEQQQQGINIVKTDDFNLIVKRGPQAMLVAAVTGNVSQSLLNKLQITIEQIHSIYTNELIDYDGDNSVFESADQPLRDCLVAEIKSEQSTRKSKPWMALILMLLLVASLCTYIVVWWQQDILMSRILNLEEPAGIHISNIKKVGWRQVRIDMLRDPLSDDPTSWLTKVGINNSKVLIDETQFFSLEKPIVKKRFNQLIKQYPEVSAKWDNNKPVLEGQMTNSRKLSLGRTLASLPGIANEVSLLENIGVQELDNRAEDNPEILQALLDLNAAKIDSTELKFDQGQSSLSLQAKEQLKVLAYNFKKVIDLASRRDLTVGLIVMGASDPSGNKTFNQRLSRERAQAAIAVLVDLGIEPNYLNPVGLGVVENSSSGKGVRKVLFNVIYFDTD